MLTRQRRPRVLDHGYIKWLRAQRCACGCLQGPPCDPAHLRAASAKYRKPITGSSMKPDDRWALPLKHWHHMAQHDCGDELGWWLAHGVKDPFGLCIEHYQRYLREWG